MQSKIMFYRERIPAGVDMTASHYLAVGVPSSVGPHTKRAVLVKIGSPGRSELGTISDANLFNDFERTSKQTAQYECPALKPLLSFPGTLAWLSGDADTLPEYFPRPATGHLCGGLESYAPEGKL